MLSKKLIELNTKVYNEYYDEGITDGWEIQDKIYNYKYLFKIQEYTGKSLKNSSILDIGCGTGSLIEHFTEASSLKQNELGNYLGIDIYKPALKIARRNFPNSEFPNVKFKDIDIFKNVNIGQFDFVFASGAFSLKLKKKTSEFGAGGNYKFLKQMITKMYSFATWGISFNFLTDKNKSRADSNLFYYNVNEVKEICENICPIMYVKNNPLKSHPEPNKPQQYEDQETVYLVKKSK